MRIVSLNIWGGRAGKDKVLDFFDTYRDVDVFCLQEVWSAPYEELEGIMAGGKPLKHDEVMAYGKQDITALLKDHVPYFHPQFRNDYGLLTFVHKKHKVINDGEVFVHLHKGYEPDSLEEVGKHARNIQYVTLETENGPLTVVNFHGLWNGQGKDDSEDRITQSENIITFLKTLSTPVVLCGDFNLKPETRSLKRFEEYGLQNLIREHGITSTRTSYYTKPERFADYTFISPELNVIDFKILPDEVSDHAALYLDLR